MDKHSTDELRKEVDKVLLGGGGHTWQLRKIMQAIQAHYARQEAEIWKDGYNKGWKARKEQTDGTHKDGKSSAGSTN